MPIQMKYGLGLSMTVLFIRWVEEEEIAVDSAKGVYFYFYFYFYRVISILNKCFILDSYNSSYLSLSSYLIVKNLI